jgi:spore coat protein CotH
MSITFKRHYPLLLLFLAVVASSVLALGSTRIIAYVVEGQELPDGAITNYDNSTDLFDDTVVHEVVVLISEEDQERMLETYQETGEKDYFSADIIIDGVRVNNVGVRLKGNASLRTAGGGMGMGGGRPDGGGGDRPAPPEGGEPPEGFQRPEGLELPEGFQLSEGFEPPEGFQLPEGFESPEGFEGPGGMGAPNFGGGEGESDLPYLVKFDEFVPGQRYQGYAEIALRTSGMGADASLLQEPVTNYALNSVGVPISQSVYASVQLTGSEPKLYTVAEHVDQVYIDRLFPDSDGVLYKVTQVGNDFSYLGEDPSLYDGIFDQKTAEGDADLAPLIDFMRFVTEASDEEFAEQLPQRFDVVAFADYLAVHNLLANNDSLAGMGNNYYLYYDFDTEMFTILSWDSNESLGKLSMGGGADMDIYWGSIGDMFGGLLDAAQQQEEAADETANAESPDTETLAEEGDAAEAESQPAARNAGSGNFRGPGGRGNHLLKERFFDTPEFLALYEERYQLLYEQIYANDLLTPRIEGFAALVTAYNAEHAIVDQDAFDAAVSSVLDFVTQRYQYLNSTELLGG